MMCVKTYVIIFLKEGVGVMTAISVTKARDNIYQISEDDRNAIQETLFLNSIPGMTESIIEGGKTPLEDCLSENGVEW